MANERGLREKIIDRWISSRKSFDRNFEQRDRDFVTLEMRRRGDYAGKFSAKEKVWRPGIASAVASYPVIARAMRSNTATSVATDIKLNFEPSTHNPAKRNAVELLKSIYLYEEQRLWTESLETAHADLGQLGGFSALRIFLDEEAKTSYGMRPKGTDRIIELAENQVLSCKNCGRNHFPEDVGLQNANKNGLQGFSREIAEEMSAQGLKDEDILKAYTPKFDITGEEICLECGQPGHLTPMNEPQVVFNEIPSQEEEEISDLDLAIEVISPLLIRYDSVSSIGFQWLKAEWFNYHFLISKNRLKAKFPKLISKIEGAGVDGWSHSLKWYYELGKPNLAHTEQLGNFDERKWFAEVDCTRFKKCAFEGEAAEGDEKIEIEGKEYQFKKGDKYIESLEKQSGKTFDGLEIYFLKDEILEIRFINENVKWVLIPWRLNPTSSVPNGEERLIRLNDQMTNLLSMRYQFVIRKANSPLVADSTQFEKSDLTRNTAGQIIMTKNNAEKFNGVQNHIGYVQPPPDDASEMALVQTFIDIAKEESGVFDETVGNTDPGNKTLGGRELAINRSLGLLGVTQKGKKLGKIAAFREIGGFWQRKPDEAFESLRGIYEDSITPQDIEDFRQLDLKRDVRITEVQGSDVPKNAPDQVHLYQLAISLGLFMKDSPIPLEHRQFILRQVLGLPIDLENYEADRRLAAKRVEIIQAIIKQKREELSLMQEPILVIGEGKFQQPTKTLHPQILNAIAVHPQTEVTEFDNHLVLIDYYDNQLKGLRVSRDINEPIIQALQAQMEQHKLIAQQMAMQEFAQNNLMTNAATIASDPNLQPDGQPVMQQSPPQMETSQTAK